MFRVKPPGTPGKTPDGDVFYCFRLPAGSKLLQNKIYGRTHRIIVPFPHFCVTENFYLCFSFLLYFLENQSVKTVFFKTRQCEKHNWRILYQNKKAAGREKSLLPLLNTKKPFYLIRRSDKTGNSRAVITA